MANRCRCADNLELDNPDDSVNNVVDRSGIGQCAASEGIAEDGSLALGESAPEARGCERWSDSG